MSEGRLRETIEGVTGCLLYATFASIPVLLIIAFIKSIDWVGRTVFPILGWATGIALKTHLCLAQATTLDLTRS